MHDDLFIRIFFIYIYTEKVGVLDEDFRGEKRLYGENELPLLTRIGQVGISLRIV